MITKTGIWLYSSQIFIFSEKHMSESDYKLKVWLEVDSQIDENKVKKELEKTWEQAGENLAKGLEKKKDSFLDKIRKFGQAGKKELDKDLVADLKLNKVHLQHQLDELNRQLKQAKKTNQNELEYEIRLKIDETKDKLNQTTSALNGLGKSWKSVGETLVWLAWKLGVWFGIAQVIQFVIKTFNEFQESQKILVQATGASGKALKELSDSVLHLQSSVNQSQNEIASAVGEVNTRLGLTGEELEQTTENYLKFATVTGQEGKQAIADNIRLFNIWGVSTQDQAFYLDQLALAGQATGVDIGNLTKNLTDNQLALEQMGFWLTESIALLSNFEKQGVNAEQALAAMKIGIAKLVEDGKTPTEAINALIESIKNAKTEAEGMQIALETFGQRGGLAMYNAIRSGTLSIEEFSKSLNNAKGTVNETHKNMETFWEWISRIRSGIWGEFVANVNDWFSQVWETMMRYIRYLENIFKTIWEGIWIIGQVIRWELDRTLAMTEKGYEMERQRNLIKQNNEVSKQYTDTANKLNSALNTFNKIKVDDSATREEFEASRKQALATAEGFRQALNAKLAFTRWMNAWLNKWSKDYAENVKLIASLEAEGRNLDKAISEIRKAKYTWTGKKKTTWWSGKKIWGGGGSKTDPIKEKKEELKKLRDLEIEAVQNSTASEFEKQAKLYDIKKEYEKKELALEGKTNDELLKTAEQFLKDYYDKKLKTSQDEQKLANDAIKKADDYKKSLDKISKTWEDMKEKASDTLRTVNHELASLDEDFWKDLGARYAEISKQLASWDGEYDEKIKLEEELLLIEQKTTAEQREQARLLSEQSETQKMIAKYEEERAQKKEYQNILQAVAWAGDVIDQKLIEITDTEVKYWDEKKWEYVAITDFKNQEYARDLYNQQLKLQTEYQETKKNYNDQIKLIEMHSKNVLNQWQSDTKAYKMELDKRKLAVQQYVADVQRMLSSIPSAHRAFGGELSNGKVALVGEHGPEQIIARASSYVQPRNAITNHSVVNTTTSQNYNLNMGDAHFWPFATVDDLLAALKSKLTYHF